MKCIKCKTEMACYNDVNDISVRIDWLRCSKCSSEAEVVYSTNGDRRVIKLTWNSYDRVLGELR